jgi:predicted dinucleotide-binding enzyme
VIRRHECKHTSDYIILLSLSLRNALRLVLFFCGHDTQAKQVVAKLITDSGFEPFDVGKISSSRFLDPLEQLWNEVSKSGIQQEYIFSLLRR